MEFPIIRILGNNSKVILSREPSNFPIAHSIHIEFENVGGGRKKIAQLRDEPGREVVVKEQLHAATRICCFSRSAA